MTSRLTREMVAEARQLLQLMEIPTVQAPSEGEAQAAHMAATSDQIWAAHERECSRDRVDAAIERTFRNRFLW